MTHSSSKQTETQALCVVYKDVVCVFLFQRLANTKAHTSRFISANLPCNKFKNRLVNIMPYESTRVCLQPIRGVEGSDYINGSFIDGYRWAEQAVWCVRPYVWMLMLCVCVFVFVFQTTEGLHRHTGSFSWNHRRFLADVMGTQLYDSSDVDQTQRDGQSECFKHEHLIKLILPSNCDWMRFDLTPSLCLSGEVSSVLAGGAFGEVSVLCCGSHGGV